jgi:O-succinylbenzoate synthase
MMVERAVLRELPLALREPFEASHGRTSERRVLLVTLHGEGLEGWGECVAGAAPSYSYETVDTAWHVLTTYVLPRVVGNDLVEPDEVLDPVAWMRGHPMARASVEMAAWDLFARAEGMSLSAMLGGTYSEIPVGVSIGLRPSVDALVEAVEQALAEGYQRVKVKVEPGRDIETLGPLRERLPDAPLTADANGAYTPADMPELLVLDGLGLEMLEQPFAAADFLGHARLQEQMRTPICLDESIVSQLDAILAVELRSCRVVNVKPGRVGGFAESLRIHDVMRDALMPIWCGGMLETGVGRAHNVAMASLPGFILPGDISASRRYWERDIVEPEFEVRDGVMRVPTAPGIGVAVDIERVEALTTRVASFP